MSGTRTGERGLSLLEVLVASSGVVIIALAIALGSRGVFAAWGQNVATSQAERRSTNALDKIVADLEDADPATIADPLSPPLGSSTITFRRQVGSVGGAAQLGPEITIAWQAAPDDPTDGVDNDGDGLIDEGRIVRTETAQTTVLADNVARMLEGETDATGDENGNGLEDELGLSFDLVGSKLTVRVTVARSGTDGDPVEKTATTSVQLRE